MLGLQNKWKRPTEQIQRLLNKDTPVYQDVKRYIDLAFNINLNSQSSQSQVDEYMMQETASDLLEENKKFLGLTFPTLDKNTIQKISYQLSFALCNPNPSDVVQLQKMTSAMDDKVKEFEDLILLLQSSQEFEEEINAEATSLIKNNIYFNKNDKHKNAKRYEENEEGVQKSEERERNQTLERAKETPDEKDIRCKTPEKKEEKRSVFSNKKNPLFKQLFEESNKKAKVSKPKRNMGFD